MSRNIRAISARHSQDKTLFELLTDAAKDQGCPSDTQLTHISQQHQIAVAHLLATSSFYDFLKADNQGKRAYVCNGTSCLLKGNQHHLQAALDKRYQKHETGEVRCLGHCYRGEAFLESDNVFDVSQCFSGNKQQADSIPFYNASSVSVFNADVDDLNIFYQSVLLNKDKIINELKDSSLRGRGGAGFPFASKLVACAETISEQKFVICNADEGDPGAFSDRYLLEIHPHLILAGMLAAAYACDAHSGFIYIRAEYPGAYKIIARAIEDFEKTTVCQTAQFKLRVIQGAGSYICGEETALLNSIEGLKPEVRTRPPYPAQQGLFDKPTLISNVETFAAIPWILKNTGLAFSAMGTEKSSGTKLVCLDHGVKRPGVYEVDMGESLQKLIYHVAGGFSVDAKAIQVGGPLGGVVPVSKIPDLTVDFESFEQQGFLLGHAGIVIIPKTFPMLDFMRHLFEFMASESCGKCLPCRLGTAKGHQMLMAATTGSAVNVTAFNDLLDVLEHGSLCGLGSGLPLPIRNIQKYFSDELSGYFVEASL
ncbi:MAG: NAD(P)H-dependent oxidoreductase subunit E [Gammaproteobacteria bacterium]|nr:NAD(P)H-dependent oxidoreductase subunit E [Gammaproteobacteria bacterium]